MKVEVTARHNITLAEGMPLWPSMSFPSLPCIAFFYSSVLGLLTPMPEIIWQSD